MPAWKALPPFNASGRFSFSLMVINDRLYATGGTDAGSVSIECLNEDTSPPRWDIVASLGQASDWGAYAVAYNSTIYMFGIYNPHAALDKATPHFNGYDVERGRWLWEPPSSAVQQQQQQQQQQQSSDSSSMISRLIRTPWQGAAGEGLLAGSGGGGSLLGREKEKEKEKEFSLPMPFSKFGCFAATVTGTTIDDVIIDEY